MLIEHRSTSLNQEPRETSQGTKEGEVEKNVESVNRRYVEPGERRRGGETEERTNPWRASRAATDTASCSGRPCYVIFHGSFPFTFSVQEPESPDLHEQRYASAFALSVWDWNAPRTIARSTSQISFYSASDVLPTFFSLFCPISPLNSSCLFWQNR